MLIRLHISLAGVPLGKGKVKMKAAEGTTVRQILEEYIRKYKVGFTLENMKGVLIMVNNLPSKLDREMNDGDQIRIFKPLAGG